MGLHEQDVQRYTDNILAGGRQDAVVSGKLGEVTLRGRRLGEGQEDVVAFYLRHVGGVRNKIKGVSFKNMGMGGAAMGPNIFAESNTRYEKETVEVARACCDTEHSVLILGQVGVGKAILAESIHRGSGRNLGPFMRLDCGLMDQEDWEELDAHWSEILPVLRQMCIRDSGTSLGRMTVVSRQQKIL